MFLSEPLSHIRIVIRLRTGDRGTGLRGSREHRDGGVWAEGEAWKPLPVAENPTGQCVRHISAPHGIHVSSGGASLPPSSQMWHPPHFPTPSRSSLCPPSTFHRGPGLSLDRQHLGSERETNKSPHPQSHLTVPGSHPMDRGSEATP